MTYSRFVLVTILFFCFQSGILAEIKSAPSNVFGKPLAYFGGPSILTRTGFFRDGYCRTSDEDIGLHSVAAIVSNAFLDFTAARGNNLRSVGLDDGGKWCICAGRWLEAYRAFNVGLVPREVVPLVNLNATEDSTLRVIELHILRQFAIPFESDYARVSNEL